MRSARPQQSALSSPSTSTNEDRKRDMNSKRARPTVASPVRGNFFTTRGTGHHWSEEGLGGPRRS